MWVIAMIRSYFFNQGEKGGFGDKFKTLQTVETPTSRIEVFEVTNLEGSLNLGLAESLYFARQQGIAPKLCRITLNQGGVILEAGALYMRTGQIESRSSLSGPGRKGPSLTGLVGNMVRSTVTQESIVKPEYWGTGEIWLEPTFEHLLILNINEAWGDIICDKGMFFACDMGVTVSVAANMNSGGLGGDGLWQTKLRGTGNIVLKSPVPPSEIMVFKMQNDVLQVDGNFALMRAGNIRYSLQRSMNTLAGSLVSGEGLLQTFEGTGMVFVAPTAKVYKYINRGTTDLPVNSNTKV